MFLFVASKCLGDNDFMFANEEDSVPSPVGSLVSFVALSVVAVHVAVPIVFVVDIAVHGNG